MEREERLEHGVKDDLHYIERDLDVMEWGQGWVTIDVVDEHWFWLWCQEEQ